MPQPKTESIKFYYNGFKINGERKLNKCSYQLRDDAVAIYAYGYATDLPKDLFVVHNDTDSMTDYFDNDHAKVNAEHPLYKFVRAAALKAEMQSCERSIDYNRRRAEQAYPSMREFYKNAAEQARDRLEKLTAEQTALGDVGQPTAADIEAVAASNTAAENAAIQARKEAEIKEREERLARQHEETEYITELMEKYPVRDGEPYVEIGFSENSTISSLRAAKAERVQKPTYSGGYIEDYGPLVLSPLAANYALMYLDERNKDIGYDKTDFAFIYTDENGDEQRYTGEYDIGIEHKSLLEHMRDFGDDEQAAEMANVFESCLLESKGFDNITPFPGADNNFPSGGREVEKAEISTVEPAKDLAYFEDLLNKTIERVFSSKKEWDNFLRFQSKFYKYDFRDRLLIYAQKPNATACADMDTWVNRMGRTVTNEENAVALISKNQNGQQLRFIFDVADTDGGPFPNLWSYTKNNRNAIISALQSDSPPDLITLERAAEEKIENILDEALDNLADVNYNSFIELKVYRGFSVSSAKTIILSRCGVEVEPFSEEIPEFASADLRLRIGQMIGEMSASVLRVAERAARLYTKNERSKQHENDVHREEVQPRQRAVVLQERQLLDSDDSAERSKRPPESRSVRTGEVSLLGGSYAAETRSDVHDGDSVHTLSGRGSAGGQDVRRADETLAEGSRSDRRIETRRYAQVGGHNGELSSARNGDSSGRADTSTVRITTFEEGNGQFSLFGDPETQNTVVIEAESVQTPSAFSLSQNVVDLFLQFGSNTSNHRKIIAAEFSKGKSNGENAAFLAELYHGGNGLTIDGKPYSAWYNEDGINIARGSFARYVNNAEIIPWEQAAERISEMLENGTFATADELADALSYERLLLAQKLWYIRHDLTDDAREIGYLSALDTNNFKGYPDETAELAEKLSDQDFVSLLAPQVNALYMQTLDGAELLRFNYHYLGAAYRGTKDLLLPRKEFVASMASLPEVQPFITEDEIDASFTRGSGVVGGSERIIEFFGADHTQAEREKFLSKEYGIGGRSHALSGADSSWEDHDGKGMTLKKGDCAEVKLTWSQAAKRIDTLIKTNRYIESKTLTTETIETEVKAQQSERTSELERTADVPAISEYDMPDLTVLPEDMHGYGYTWDGMLPLSENMARRLFEDEGLEVFCLYNDDTESAVTSIEQIEEHADYSGIFGIQADVWLRYCEKQKAEKANEPNFPSSGREVVESEPQRDYTFEYQLLSRLQMDCDYFLSNGGRYEPKLWAGNVNKQIAKMRELYDLLPDKPDWLTADEIDDYERKMQPRYQVVVYHSTENGFDEREDYQSFRDALSRAKAYVDGTAEEDGFKYEGATIYDNIAKQYIYTYGEIAVENEPVTQIDNKNIVAVYHAPIYDDRYESRIEIVHYPIGTYGINYGATPDNDWTDARQSGFETFDDAIAAVMQRAPNARKLEIPVREREQNVNFPSGGTEVDKDVLGNFRITDDNLGVGGAKAKYRANVAAIRLLKQLEADGMQALPEQQEVLSRYVGWGGIADAFDPRKENWQAEYYELKDLLTDEEYRSARGSVNNAHYTSPTIIRAVYAAVERMGFEKGKILEPAMGIGNFLGCLPESMQGSDLHGVELDDISGRIAKQLYPTADITIAGFETTKQKDFYDLAIGNVPFGDYSVNDREYNKLGFSIHDYFFAKALDQVRPGGIVAFVTSRYTMDKKSPDVRRHLAQRAELLGAIRLPNNAFKANAGAEVVTDIIFLQKRERPIVTEPDWVHLDYNADGFAINSYFTDHPEMILGRESSASTPYGKEDFTVEPFGDLPLDRQLSYAIQNIRGKYEPATVQPNFPSSGREVKEIGDSIPADPNVRDYSYAVVDGKVYFREGDIMRRHVKPPKMLERIAGMVSLRDQTRRLIDLQLDPDTPETEIRAEQEKLSDLYDDFAKKNGLINDKANSLAFRADQSYYLLCGLEDFDKEGNFVGKSAFFSKRTIQAKTIITHTETAAEALAVSLSEKGVVDIGYICALTGKDEDTVTADLKGIIYKQPEDNSYVTADEYLSGNIRRKLDSAEYAAVHEPEFEENVAALKEAMPEWLTAEQIEIRLGATWIDPEYIEQFIYETLDIAGEERNRIEVAYEPKTATWSVIDSRRSNPGVIETVTYGTERKPALRLIEDGLNLKHTEVFDYKEVDGKKVAEKNITETVLAQDRQEQLKNLFVDWIWQDPERRENLEREYNERFNSTVPRTYDGEHLTFPGMNPEIQLTDYQKDAVARRLYGNNELLGHAAGAGKTYTMIATAQKMKQLGLCSKSMFVVPNHLTKQWARDYIKLYPNANILVATDDDLSPQNRKKFCARIATGDYDAVIIKQSQFEKIPVSAERRQQYVQSQLNDLEIAVSLLDGKDSRQNFSIKQLEKTKKNLELKLEKIQESLKSKQDDMLSFEQLGIDNLFVDEAHHYKNLAYYTKMSNVAGVSNNSAQLAADMEEKCRYINEITGYRGITFATATFVMNSVAEEFVMQRYLQPNRIEELGWNMFDSWVGQFGEVTLENELAPEGNTYRERKRLSRFSNLPELMRVFHEVADIKRASELNLPLPEAEYHIEVSEASDIQKEYVKQLGERATAVHLGMVEPNEDNMLKITGDGRKIGLDPRIIDPSLPDNPDSKVNKCVNNILHYYKEGAEERLTQLVFCDLSTPGKRKNFNMVTDENGVAVSAPFQNVYDDVKAKLMAHGIPENEIAFVHDCATLEQKEALFKKVRSGEVRVLFGSTQMLGEGTNVQDKLLALHDLDCPWRPGDLEQRLRRILRQGNMNSLVHIHRYVTNGTFDSYLWQSIEIKQKFIDQIMSPNSTIRSFQDPSCESLSYAEIKSLCAGNPAIKRKMELEVAVGKLRLKLSEHLKTQNSLYNDIKKKYPVKISESTAMVENLKEGVEIQKAHPLPEEGFVGLTVNGRYYDKPGAAGGALLAYYRGDIAGEVECEYRGFKVNTERYYMALYVGNAAYNVDLFAIDTGVGVIGRLNALIDLLPKTLERTQAELADAESNLEKAKQEYGKPFDKADELKAAEEELKILDAQLSSADDTKDIRGFAGQVYDLVKIVMPETLPQDRKPTECINGMADNIRAGRTEIVIKPLKNVLSVGNYEQRQAAKKLISAYELKAKIWTDPAKCPQSATPTLIKTNMPDR